MVLVEKARNFSRSELLQDTYKFLWGSKIRPVLDLTGIIKGVMALEEMDLYNMEDSVGRATTKIDLGVELYDMEAGWD
ncbi:hypothetical protein HN807_10970 [Candidatus Bathyarchaeota archaeon]|jgi:hypothetical protein|nr:hypothetical protein [Candidatus Bathyarchaeota archaeon]MBT4320917.1 hypothetical protein [Candidatus Bathyarchaeota archaeon]MBT4423190.1 hypothetical protein [Candidatus Bathyarchaeota archaeon]MBT5642256.1 hypothetical protein [Candidatus Bathyarchaeota archaeon]MBT6605947.1 hypothetical protein [Candidatus Bathyarchaeota archaeon]